MHTPSQVSCLAVLGTRVENSWEAGVSGDQLVLILRKVLELHKHPERALQSPSGNTGRPAPQAAWLPFFLVYTSVFLLPMWLTSRTQSPLVISHLKQPARLCPSVIPIQPPKPAAPGWGEGQGSSSWTNPPLAQTTPIPTLFASHFTDVHRVARGTPCRICNTEIQLIWCK